MRVLHRNAIGAPSASRPLPSIAWSAARVFAGVSRKSCERARRSLDRGVRSRPRAAETTTPALRGSSSGACIAHVHHSHVTAGFEKLHEARVAGGRHLRVALLLARKGCSPEPRTLEARAGRAEETSELRAAHRGDRCRAGPSCRRRGRDLRGSRCRRDISEDVGRGLASRSPFVP
jgi:hypothetical protein